MRTIVCFFCLLLFLSNPAQAWDSIGHRLSAAIALQFISADTRAGLLNILSQHPRYQEDFLNAIPAFIDREDAQQLAQWLLGQAAYWPDIARGLPQAERERFNRPAWHYTDGARVRGNAPFQGNNYLGIDAFADVPGPDPATITDERAVDNIVTALDYNTRILADSGSSATERAIALCWVLHLVGDIHQPLHTGSLFTETLFAAGDRGGNAIPVADTNLHSLWDRALSDEGVAAGLPAIMEQVAGFSPPRIESVASDWTAWMAESRQYLQSMVYSPAMRETILAAEAADRRLQPISLDSDYIAQMRQIARLRLGLAGLRLAIWFENELP